jgi:hypothetical protein
VSVCLGSRLIAGDATPYPPREGGAFLIDVTKAAGAEAPANLTVLFAVGARVGQSWNEGLSALALAPGVAKRISRNSACATKARGQGRLSVRSEPCSAAWRVGRSRLLFGNQLFL